MVVSVVVVVVAAVVAISSQRYDLRCFLLKVQKWLKLVVAKS